MGCMVTNKAFSEKSLLHRFVKTLKVKWFPAFYLSKSAHSLPQIISGVHYSDYLFITLLYRLFTPNNGVMKYILFLSALCLSFAGSAQQWAKQYDNVDECSCGLAQVTKGDKHGYVTKDGTVVVPLIYEDALHFSENMAAVKKNGKWGFIDTTGKEVIPPQYGDANSFADGLAVVMKDNKYGFIDNTGKTIIPFIYTNASGFSEGLAAVSKNGLWGFIDKTGKEAITCRYGFAGSFSEGVAKVMKESKWMTIDKSGKRVAD